MTAVSGLQRLPSTKAGGVGTDADDVASASLVDSEGGARISEVIASARGFLMCGALAWRVVGDGRRGGGLGDRGW